MYAQKVEGDEWREEKIDKSKIDKMNGPLDNNKRHQWTSLILIIDQQIGQLYELMQAIQRQGGNDGEGQS